MTDISATLSSEKLIVESGTYSISANQTYIASDGQSVFVLPVGATPTELGSRGVVQKFDLDGNMDNTFTIEYDKAGLDSSTAYRISYCNSRLYVTGYMNNTNQGTAVFTGDGKFEKKLNVQLGIQADSICKIDGQLVVFGSITGNTAKRAMWLNNEGNITKEVFFPGGVGGATPLEIHYIGGGIIISRTKNSGAFLTFNAHTLEQLNSVDLNWPSTSVVYAQTWADDRLITLTSRYEGLMWDSYTLNVGSATSGGPSTSEPTDPTGPTDPSDPNLTPVSITTVTGDNIPTDATVRSYWAETGELISELGGVVEPPSELIVQHASSGSVLSNPIVGELEAKTVNFNEIEVHANSDLYKGINILSLCNRPTAQTPFVFKAKLHYPSASTPAAGTASTAFNVGIAAVPTGGSLHPTPGAAYYGLPLLYDTPENSTKKSSSVIGAIFYKPVGATSSNDDWVGYFNETLDFSWVNSTSLTTDATETDIIVTITPQGGDNYELKVSINGTEDSVILNNTSIFPDETADIYLYLNFHNYEQSAPWKLTNIKWPAGISTGGGTTVTTPWEDTLIKTYSEGGSATNTPAPSQEYTIVGSESISCSGTDSINSGRGSSTLHIPLTDIPETGIVFEADIKWQDNTEQSTYGALGTRIDIGVFTAPTGTIPTIDGGMSGGRAYGPRDGNYPVPDKTSFLGLMIPRPDSLYAGTNASVIYSSSHSGGVSQVSFSPSSADQKPNNTNRIKVRIFKETYWTIEYNVDDKPTYRRVVNNAFIFTNDRDSYLVLNFFNRNSEPATSEKVTLTNIVWPVEANLSTGGENTGTTYKPKDFTPEYNNVTQQANISDVQVTDTSVVLYSQSTNSTTGSVNIISPVISNLNEPITLELDLTWGNAHSDKYLAVVLIRTDTGITPRPSPANYSFGRYIIPNDATKPPSQQGFGVNILSPSGDGSTPFMNVLNSINYNSLPIQGVVSSNNASAVNKLKFVFKANGDNTECEIYVENVLVATIVDPALNPNDINTDYRVIVNSSSGKFGTTPITLDNLVLTVGTGSSSGGEISTIKSYLPTDMRAVYQAFDYEAGKFDVITTDNILEIYSTTPNGGYWGGAYAVLDLAEKQPDKITVSFEHEFTPSSGTQLRIFLAQMPTGENLYTSTSNFYYASPADASANNTNQDVYGVSISRSNNQREIIRKGSDVSTYVDVSIPDTVPNQNPTIAIPTPYKIEFIKIADGYNLKLFLEEQLLVEKTIPYIVSNDPNKDLKLVVNIIKKEYLGSHKLHNFKVDIGGVVSGPGELLVPKYAPYYITAHNKEFTLMGAKSYNELETLDTITLDDPAINGTGDIVGKTIGNVVNGNGNNVRAQLRLYSKTTGKLISNNSSNMDGYNTDAPSGDTWYGVAIDSANRIDYQTFEANTNPNHTYVIKGSLDFITTINGAAVPINSLIPINSQEAWYLDPAGYVFLRSGTVSINTSSYPDAYSYNGELGLPEEKYVEGIPLYLRVK